MSEKLYWMECFGCPNYSNCSNGTKQVWMEIGNTVRLIFVNILESRPVENFCVLIVISLPVQKNKVIG